MNRNRLRRALAAIALVALTCAHVPAAPAAASAADTLAVADRSQAVERLHELVTAHFAHWAAVSESAFEKRFTVYRRRALATPDRREFSLLTRELIASLQNGHTTFSDPWARELDPLPLPFTLAFLDDEWVVTHSTRSDLAPGTVVTRVDDRPIDAFYATIAPYLCASSERARRAQFTSRGFLWPRVITLTTAANRAVRIERRPEAAGSTAPEPSALEDRWLARDSIAYLAIRSFDDASIENRAIAALRARYLRAPVLIVDVRGNGGGDTPRRLTRMLLADRPYSWWKEDPDRAPQSVFDRIGAIAKRAEIVRPTFAGRVLVLTDGDCASSCEDFVMPLVWAKRATVVGDTTLGSTGQPAFADLGAGMRASVGARCAHFPDGSPFEGVGISPDVLVRRTREDVISGEDRALATALALARRDLGRK